MCRAPGIPVGLIPTRAGIPPTSSMIRTQENARRNNNKLPWYYIGVASDPPVDLFDRRLEWEALSRWALDPTPGLQVAVVWGRRRQGKSYLLRRLCAATGGLYHQAIEHATPQSLDELGARVGEHLGVGRLAFADWDEAISSLARLAPRTHAAARRLRSWNRSARWLGGHRSGCGSPRRVPLPHARGIRAPIGDPARRRPFPR